MPLLGPGSLADIAQLPSRKARDLAIVLLAGIELGVVKGKRLHRQAHTGDLSDCFKVAFDFERGMGLRYRVVYRHIVHREASGPRIEVVAVGRREDSDVYLTALRRLGR